MPAISGAPVAASSSAASAARSVFFALRRRFDSSDSAFAADILPFWVEMVGVWAGCSVLDRSRTSGRLAQADMAMQTMTICNLESKWPSTDRVPAFAVDDVLFVLCMLFPFPLIAACASGNIPRRNRA